MQTSLWPADQRISLFVNGTCHRDTAAAFTRDTLVSPWLVCDRPQSCVDSILAVQINAIYVVSSSNDDSIRIWMRKRSDVRLHQHTMVTSHSGLCVKVLTNQASIFEMALHPCSILVTWLEGWLVAWNLPTDAERLRTVPLTDFNISVELTESTSASMYLSAPLLRLTVCRHSGPSHS